MRDEVWLVYYDPPNYFEPELHIICRSTETAQEYINKNSDRVPDDFKRECFKIEKHQVY